jgi:hypothetical protein
VIVLGARGRSVLSRYFLGSTSDGLVHHAPCSAYVVRSTPGGEPSQTGEAKLTMRLSPEPHALQSCLLGPAGSRSVGSEAHRTFSFARAAFTSLAIPQGCVRTGALGWTNATAVWPRSVEFQLGPSGQRAPDAAPSDSITPMEPSYGLERTSPIVRCPDSGAARPRGPSSAEPSGRFQKFLA